MTDYDSEYEEFDKYSNQTESIANALSQIIRPGARIIDIGSHNGALTELLIESLTPSHLTSVEPDPDLFAHLADRLKGKAELYNGRFEDLSLDEPADLVLNSHTFYHFENEDWAGLIAKANSYLSEKGIHVIFLDSEDTSFYSLTEIMRQIPEKPLTTFGKVVTSADLESVLNKHGIRYDKSKLDDPLVLPTEIAYDMFTRILGFIFRYTKSQIQQHTEKEVRDFMSQFAAVDKIIIPRYQEMFVIPNYHNL